MSNGFKFNICLGGQQTWCIEIRRSTLLANEWIPLHGTIEISSGRKCTSSLEMSIERE